MGVGMSAVDSSRLLSLCKKRKELIKAAVDCRYELVSAHIMYLQSLLDMGNALHQFVVEDLETVPDSSSDLDSHLNFSSLDSELESESLSGCFHDHLQFSGGSSESSGLEKACGARTNMTAHMGHRPSGVMGGPVRGDGRNSNRENDRYVPIVDVRYYTENNKVPIDAAMDNSTGNSTYATYGHQESTAVPRDFPYEFWSPYIDTGIPQEASAPAAAPSAAPSSPEPVGWSAWEHFNPFNNKLDDVYRYSDYYSQVHTNHDSDDPDVRKIREKEGIPDLEDDTAQIFAMKITSNKMKSKKDARGDSGGDTKNGDQIQSPQETESKNVPDNVEEYKLASSSSSGSISMEKEHSMEEGEGSEEDQSFTSDSVAPEMDIHCTRDLQQAIKEIKNAFETSFNYGQEVSILLEVGKLPYQTTCAKVKLFASWLVRLASPSYVISSQRPVYILTSRSASKKMLSAKVVCENYQDVYRKSNCLSSILEKLYVWEKKLYEEVKGEENIRVIYDQEWKRLKCLDDRGAEHSQIDRIHASVKSLLSKIKVPLSAIEAISIRIHKIRDEELQCQLNELIIGLSRMWKLMMKCHEKQFQTIIHAKNCVHIAGTNSHRGSPLKATRKLEKETLKWATRFGHYIRTQKAFASFLNNWLLNYIPEELKTPAEVDPLSPNRIGAPSIFIICNDWYNAIQSISEDGVYEAVLGFASILHHLQEKRDEERHQRNKAKKLWKDIGNRFEEEDSVSLRKMLDEQKVTHQEAVKLANDAASDCLTGLAPVFETLKSFCEENIKAYDKIRIPTESTSRK